MHAEPINDRFVALDGHPTPALNVMVDGDATTDGFVGFDWPTENGAQVSVTVDLGGDTPGQATVGLWVPGPLGADQDDWIQATLRQDPERIVPVDSAAPDTGTERLLLSIFGPVSWSCTDVADLRDLCSHLAQLPIDMAEPVTSMSDRG